MVKKTIAKVVCGNKIDKETGIYLQLQLQCLCSLTRSGSAPLRRGANKFSAEGDYKFILYTTTCG